MRLYERCIQAAKDQLCLTVTALWILVMIACLVIAPLF